MPRWNVLRAAAQLALGLAIGGMVILALPAQVWAWVDEHEGMAAWLQAVFSVATLVVVVYLLYWSFRDRQHARLDRRIEGLEGLIARLNGITVALRERLLRTAPMKPGSVEALEFTAEVENLQWALADLHDALAKYRVMETPSWLLSSVVFRAGYVITDITKSMSAAHQQLSQGVRVVDPLATELSALKAMEETVLAERRRLLE